MVGRVPARAGHRSAALRLGLAALPIIALAVLAVVLRGGRSNNAAVAPTLGGTALGVFGIDNGQPRDAIALSAVPSQIAAGLGADWATSYDNGTLLRIDPSESAVVQTVFVGHGASGVAVAAGDVWVADTLDNQLTRVNAAADVGLDRFADQSNQRHR